jgi:hypothetical protein
VALAVFSVTVHLLFFLAAGGHRDPGRIEFRPRRSGQ